MSSGRIDTRVARHLFEAPPSVDLDTYVTVTYLVGSSRSGEESALAMAMEQSAATTFMPNYEMVDSLDRFTAKVLSVSEVPGAAVPGAIGYDLETDVYQIGAAQQQRLYRIRLAFPHLLLVESPSQYLNVIVGEIPRLGFITSLQIEDIDMKALKPDGPAFGVPGLRRLLGVETGPILCRSTRPAVGLDRETMRRINIDVLTNGFHAVKDDELQAWDDSASYKRHVESMVSGRKAAEDAAGEKKIYVANLLCDGWDLERRLEIACEAGADGLLVAPAIQGLSVLAWVKRQSKLPILAHNSGSEIFTRHPSWGLAPALYLKLQRYCGADWVVTTGDFSHSSSSAEEARSIVAAAQGAVGNLEPSMLILQGGKNPGSLPDCVEAVGGTDFMLIVASWVDGHPQGLAAAAQLFRKSVDALDARQA